MIFLALVVSFVLATAFGKILIPWLERANFGQEVRDEGPKSHLKKQGTPTMGGILFFVASALTLLVFGREGGQAMAFLFVAAFLFGIIGFVDDGLKIFMKRSLGLTAKQKLILQFVDSLILIYWATNGLGLETSVWIPLFNKVWHLGIFYWPLMVFIILGTTNACNLTDGLDGLLSSVTIIVLAAYLGIGYLSKDWTTAMFSAVMIGSLGAFLLYNRFPAKVFMGDTGSFFIGGAVVGLAMLTKTEFLLPVLGLVYMAEALSVIIQVVVFKKTGKRVFRMSPLHHHFELGGLGEKQVVLRFSLVVLICAVLATALYVMADQSIFLILRGVLAHG